MAAMRKICLGMVSVSLAMTHSSGAPPTQDVRHAFSAIPYPRSIYIWWRPYHTILPEETATRIRSQLDNLPGDGASSTELGTLLGDDIKTAFLYPILAGEGNKGATALRRMLDEYSDGRTLDDRWLLIVFALGCSDSDQAVPTLRRELRRIQDMFARTDPRRTVDAKLPIIDALLINLSRSGALTYTEIELLCRADPERAGAILLLGLNYSHAWMSGKRCLDMIRLALHQIGEESILSSLDSAGQRAGHLRAIRDFLLAPRRIWPVARQAVLSGNATKKRAHDFLLVTYLLVLTHQANGAEGVYELDRAVVDKYLRVDLSRYPQASFAARILLKCVPSRRVGAWREYIEGLASHIRPEDVEMADFLARDTGEVTLDKQQLYDPDEVAPQMEAPGIYLYGFRGAGGVLPSEGKRQP